MYLGASERSHFRKYYGLCSSELPLGKFQRLKIQDFGIPLLTRQCFFFMFIHNISRTVKPEAY